MSMVARFWPSTMTVEKISKTLLGDTPGKITELVYYRIGPKNPRKKVYLQAALHADEQPGILILHHLLQLLQSADQAAEFLVWILLLQKTVQLAQQAAVRTRAALATDVELTLGRIAGGHQAAGRVAA